MGTLEITRKLAAILAADVEGYSRLMGLDEAGTLRTLTSYRAIADRLITKHHGRIANTAGDSVLAELSSVVEAVECAIAIQRAISQNNEKLSPEGRMHFRIGLHIGDVLVRDGDLYGDGVNIAARLQTLAEPGGICISQSVRDQIEGRIAVEFEDAGLQTVKNIARPVHVWRWTSYRDEERERLLSASKGIAPATRPSIAVLPFQNMSGEPDQNYFADGIAEDIITELSQFRDLFVIAHNSTFAYKGRTSVGVRQVARELGVRYVLEGSVRKAANRVRITAQLIDAETGGHLWAQRYDRELADIFAVQDEVTQSIAAVLPGRLEAADLEHARRKPPANMAAYDYFLRAKEMYHRVTSEDNRLSQNWFAKAIELDPGYGHAHAWLACTIGQSLVCGFVPWTDEEMRRAKSEAQTALALNDDDSEAHRILGDICIIERRFEQAEFHHERAIGLNSNDPRIVSQRGELLMWLGRPDEGVPWIEKAIRLDPVGAERRTYNLGRAFFSARRYAEAATTLTRLQSASSGRHAYLAASYAQLGDSEQARRHAAEVQRLTPDFSARRFAGVLPYKDAADREHLATALVKSGLPD